MRIEDLKSEIFNDNYISIAIDEYFKFKFTDEYDEQYKGIVLREINEYMLDKRITSENVLDIIKFYQIKNPSTGSFVHWTSLDDLVKYTEANPAEVTELLNYLFESSIDIEDRIKRFYEQGKAYDRNINLSTSLFSYLLAGYDLNKYPLYKEDTFRNLLNSFGIKYTLGGIPAKYSDYYDLCEILLEYFEENNYKENPNMLDVQDFIFCIANYRSLYIRVSVRYIYEHADIINSFSLDDNLFLDYINQMDRDSIDEIYNRYHRDDKINNIRYKIAEKIINDGKINIDELENIIELEKDKYEKDITRSYNNFKILFPFYYFKYKDKVNIELKRIFESIRTIDAFKDYEFEENKFICDFYGPNNFGTDNVWLVLYPKGKETHRVCAQLYFEIGFVDEELGLDKISYGLNYGDKLLKMDKSLKRDIKAIKTVEEFNYKDMEKKFIEVFEEFKRVNNEFSEDIDGGTYEEEIDGNEEEKEISLEINFNREIKINKLFFEDREIIANQVSTAIKSGKHIILVGPPGTGKSKLAKEICESYGAQYRMVTAMSDWSSYDTIGGYKPKEDGTLYFDEGVFLQLFKDKESNRPMNKWLIIDEINRADIDKAFGSLFSALTGDEMTLSFKSNSKQNIILRPEKDSEEKDFNDYEYIIPKDWRIIGTMNTFDKTSLYEMSYAFMRRFAFIPIGIPEKIDKDLLNNYFKLWGIEDKSINNVNLQEGLAEVWNIINKYRVIGPAIIEDMARYISIQGDYTSGLILYVFPQFEGLTENEIFKFTEELYKSSIENFTQEKNRLNSFIRDFFRI